MAGKINNGRVNMYFGVYTGKARKPLSLGESDLESSVKLLEGLKTGMQAVKKDFPHVEVQVYVPYNAHGLVYSVYLSGEASSVREAVTSIFNAAGLPFYVDSGYDIANQVLACHGKTTKRKFGPGMVGKYVVDKK